MKPECKIDEFGNKQWFLNGELHREDGPAVERADGTREWFLNGKLHREDGPAIEWDDGSKQWFLDGKRHREDGPAIERADGTKLWYLGDTALEISSLKELEEEVKIFRIQEVQEA